MKKLLGVPMGSLLLTLLIIVWGINAPTVGVWILSVSAALLIFCAGFFAGSHNDDGLL
jgi:hypothetical protein